MCALCIKKSKEKERSGILVENKEFIIYFILDGKEKLNDEVLTALHMHLHALTKS